MSKICLVIGATSGIGHSTAMKFAQEGYDLIVTGRNINALKEMSETFQNKYNINIKTILFELNKSDDSIRDLFDEINFLDISVILISIGVLEVNNPARYDSYLKLLDVNFIGPSLIVHKIKNLVLEHREKINRNISIIVISSVAGDKGKSSNYLYGATKSALTTYLSGIRQELYHISKHVHICTVLPGFVDTNMIKGMRLPKYLISSKENIAKSIYHAYKTKKDIIYVKSIWRLIMLVIRLIPEYIFKKLKL